jgi:hypothetical protein
MAPDYASVALPHGLPAAGTASHESIVPEIPGRRPDGKQKRRQGERPDMLCDEFRQVSPGYHADQEGPHFNSPISSHHQTFVLNSFMALPSPVLP